MSEQNPSFKPSLSLLDATMIVAGSMIGSGIFIVSADIMRNVGSPGWLLVCWLVTGFMTITAAVSYGELSGMFPRAGGQYVYLKEAYNPLMAFLYGWSLFSVIQTATIAAVGVAFARFSAYIFPALSETNILWSIGDPDNPSFKFSAAQLTSILLIILLTYVNTRGVKEGKIIQTTFTLSKLIALFGLIVFGFLLAKDSFWAVNWSDPWHARKDLGVGDAGMVPVGWTDISGVALIGGIAAGMVGSIFSSDSWHNVTFIAGEIKNPKRNIGLALFLGTLIVTILYVATNLMYLNTLPIEQIAYPQEDRLAVASASKIFGAEGQIIVAVLIMISPFGCNNGLILAGARVYYSMAKDGLFFKPAGVLNKNAVPQWALWAQCVMASVLCLSGSYGNLLDMIAFVAVLFYAITITGIFILRKKRPDIERPYKAFGYPVLPIVYIVLALTFCIFLVSFKPTYSLWGLGIVLAGVPVYFIAMSNKKQSIS